MQKGHVRRLDAAVAWWMRGVARRPILALALLATLCVLSAIAATGLRIDTDSSRMLNLDLPFQARAQAVAEAFPATKNAVVAVVRSDHGDAADRAVADLSARLAAREDAIGRVFAPSADPFLISHGLLYSDLDALDRRLTRLSQASNLIAELRGDPTWPGFLGALDRAVTLAEGAGIDASTLDPVLAETAAVLRAEAAGELRPFDWQRAFAEEPREGPVTRLVTVEPVFDFSRLSPARPAIDAVREEAAALSPDLRSLVEIGVTGDPVLRAEELQSVTSRLAASFGLSLFLVAAVLFLTLGRAGRVGLALSTVFVTLLLTTGFAALSVGALNLISIAFVVLMVGLGIDFAIHLMAHVDEAARLGKGPDAALDQTGREIGQALLLSALTTSAAFLAFTGTDFVGMAQLGLIGGGGVLIALAVALTLVPTVIGLRPRVMQGRGRLPMPDIRPRAARALMWTALGIGLAAVALAPQARFDADPMGLRDPAAPSVATYAWLTGDPALAPLRLSLIVPDDATARAAAESLDSLPEVRSAVWLGDLVPGDQAEKLDLIDLAWPSLQFAVEGEAVVIEAPEAGALAPRLAALGTPAGRALAAELDRWVARADPAREAALGDAVFAFFPDLIERLAAQLDVGEVTVDDLPAPLVDRFRSSDGRLRVDISPEADVTDPAARAAFVDAVAAAAPEAGGPPAQVEGAARAVSSAMIEAAATALCATLLLAFLVLRRLRLVAAIIVPLVLAGAVTMAASVLIGQPFNYANIIVLPLMIGVGVDAGIHLALRTEYATEAVFDTSTPRAVLASALTTVAAFGTLALSDHPGTASMGVMLSIAMAASVAMIFALTPALVRLGR